MSKNLQKPYGKTQPYASGNFSRFPSQGNVKYNSQQFRSKSINKPFRHSTSTGKQRVATEAFSSKAGPVRQTVAPPILTLKPATRLKHFLFQWQILTQDPTILNIVQGYRLHFHTQPSQTVKQPILNAEISKLQLKGAIRPVNFTNAAFYSRLFLVPKKGGDLRPVIDLSALNQFVINEHFQMENISCLKQILNQNDFMVKLDLKDAYLTVGVHEQSQHYLRFIWQGQAYQFQALPFGLCTAPRVFTKLLKPVITFLRTRNIRLLIYLDDILIVASDIKTLKEQTGQVLDLLQSLGFIINFEKSVLTPFPVMEFLGLLVDSRTMMFYLPSHKVTKTIELCKSLLQNRTASLRELAIDILNTLDSASHPAGRRKLKPDRSRSYVMFTCSGHIGRSHGA